MSAWIVSKKHIDYMVTAALTCERKRGYGPDYGGQRVHLGNADEVGAGLLAENIESVAYRYDSRDLNDLPGPIKQTRPEQYRYRPQPPGIDVVTAIKAIHCYEYQSCEHPGWDTSAAKAFCEELKGGLICCLPGYEDAPWGID
jgi:hypothetical protein